MCSTSAMLPVVPDAGSASARRMLGGKSESAAAPAVPPASFKKSRRFWLGVIQPSHSLLRFTGCRIRFVTFEAAPQSATETSRLDSIWARKILTSHRLDPVFGRMCGIFNFGMVVCRQWKVSRAQHVRDNCLVGPSGGVRIENIRHRSSECIVQTYWPYTEDFFDRL